VDLAPDLLVFHNSDRVCITGIVGVPMLRIFNIRPEGATAVNIPSVSSSISDNSGDLRHGGYENEPTSISDSGQSGFRRNV
jgi:hypothetical protein